MTVSIITPVYKTPAALLVRFLKSVFSQTLTDIELIAVNDASPDDCPRILDAAAAEDDRMTVIHRTVNGRAGMARNDGLDAARGDFILFADADDFMRPDMCKTLATLARTHDADIVACSWAEVAEGGKVIRTHRLADRLFDLEVKRDRTHCSRTLTYALWNKLFRREAIHGLRFEQFEVNIGEDTLFNVAALCGCRRMITTTHVGYEYTIASESASHRKAKGLPYLETIARSQERIRKELERAYGTEGRMHADWLALKRYTTGSEWIAGNPDIAERKKLRKHWHGYLVNELLPGMTNYLTLARFFYLLGLLGNVKGTARLMRMAVRGYDRLLFLPYMMLHRTNQSKQIPVGGNKNG